MKKLREIVKKPKKYHAFEAGFITKGGLHESTDYGKWAAYHKEKAAGNPNAYQSVFGQHPLIDAPAKYNKYGQYVKSYKETAKVPNYLGSLYSKFHWKSARADNKINKIAKRLEDHYEWHSTRNMEPMNDYNNPYSFRVNDHQSAIDHYCTHGSRPLNRALHNNETLDDSSARCHEHLASACTKHKTPFPLKVYAGIRRSPGDHHEEGEEHIRLHLKGYTSTSLNHTTAKDFTGMGDQAYGKHVLKIHVPKGSHGAYVGHVSSHPAEKEFILHHGAKLHVNPTPRWHKDKETMIWDAHLVHDGVKDVK